MKPKRKKISTVLPSDLLSEAVELSKANQTDTLIMALKELIRAHRRKSVLDLRGKIKVNFDIQRDRERGRF
jgi:hypothetical protein